MSLVNNAGIVRDAQLVKYKGGKVQSRMTDEAWEAVIGVNLRGVFNCTRAVAPHMIAGGGGAILNASSVACLNGNFGQTNYVATKAGVIGMTKTWSSGAGKIRHPRQCRSRRASSRPRSWAPCPTRSSMPWSATLRWGGSVTRADIAEAYLVARIRCRQLGDGDDAQC